ncbi:putative poly(A)-specific ribonuclease [Helianthus debilis subsp. tardiflorus]
MKEDVYANDSVKLLRESGIDFKKNNQKGINVGRFGELLMFSDIVLNNNVLQGGLNKLAHPLEVERIGICHHAGSDSLLTSCTFRKLIKNFFSGSLEKYAGVL